MVAERGMLEMTDGAGGTAGAAATGAGVAAGWGCGVGAGVAAAHELAVGKKLGERGADGFGQVGFGHAETEATGQPVS